MNPWIAKGVILAASAVMIAIRAPFGQRSLSVKIAKDLKDRKETILLAIAMLGFVIPFAWIVSPLFSFAEYPLRIGPLGAGIACFAAGLWLFYRSHVDLGTNWSITLQVRQGHRLVIDGVYRRIRHPMYSALFLYSFGQLLVIPNWCVGPTYLLSFGILFAFRVRAEERMMLDAFGDEYAAFMATTKRLIPGLW